MSATNAYREIQVGGLDSERHEEMYDAPYWKRLARRALFTHNGGSMSGIDYSRALAPTRADWLQYRDQLCSTHSFSRHQAGRVLHTILGACPPEPCPLPVRINGRVVVSPSLLKGTVWTIYGGNITADEADRIASGLVEHARYARVKGEACNGR